MPNIHLLELPVKHALVAAILYVVTSFLLGYLYQFLALASIDMSRTNGVWEEIKALGEFSLYRAIRYFVFYFFVFLGLVCFSRFTAKSSPWGVFILFALIPSAMSFIPFLFSGEFQVSPHWALTAMLIVLVFFGGDRKTEAKQIRIFFALLVIAILAPDILSDAFEWLAEIHKAAARIYGDRLAESVARSSLLYFAPAAIVSVAIKFYLIYKIPKNFVRDLQPQNSP